jgi:hypothetical protein
MVGKIFSQNQLPAENEAKQRMTMNAFQPEVKSVLYPKDLIQNIPYEPGFRHVVIHSINR